MNEDRVWIQTYTGKQFFLDEITAEQIDIKDIAHALSLICRYTGHCAEFYSVAQHSILVSQQLPDELKLDGLMHDAAEAYIGDISTPLKSLLPEYRKLEGKIFMAIADKFKLRLPEPHDVILFDRCLCATEVKKLMKKQVKPWAIDINKMYIKDLDIIPYSSWTAEFIFLNLFDELKR